MGLSLLFQGMTTATSVGMGCGTCCGSSISVFLSGYLATHAKDFRQSVGAFLSFYLGKILAVILICAAASWVGSSIMDDEGTIAGIPVHLIVDLFMLGMGVWFLVKWVLERRGVHRCKSCNHCGASEKAVPKGKDVNHLALLGMGAGYGASPCAPLLMMAGYAATLPLAYAAVVGGVFALASALSPTILLLLLSGALAGRLRKEIPEYLTWFRLACYVLLLIFFSIDLVSML